jgi:hypothetical protein
MVITVSVRYVCDQCGYERAGEKSGDPRILGEDSWNVLPSHSSRGMLTDLALPGKTFCSRKCHKKARCLAGLPELEEVCVR